MMGISTLKQGISFNNTIKAIDLIVINGDIHVSFSLSNHNIQI